MPVLLLAQGDAAAKDMLRRAIEARYGPRPPALDRLQIDFKGRSRVKVGPVMTWVPVDVVAYFSFPTAMRWDFIIKPMGLPVQRGIEAYDGTTYRSMRGGKAPHVVDDPAAVSAIRQRLWAVASVMLMPLSDLFVRLEQIAEGGLRATNTQLGDFADIYLRPDDKIDYVSVHCLNPDSGDVQDFIVRTSPEQKPVDDLLIPEKLTMLWDEEPTIELTPEQARINPELPPALFTLDEGAAV